MHKSQCRNTKSETVRHRTLPKVNSSTITASNNSEIDEMADIEFKKKF
jgi:hypothetical protein